MNPLIYGLILAIFALVMMIFVNVLKKKRAGSEKYQNILETFQQNVNGMLEAGETVEAVCGYKPCAAVTNKRLLVGTKEGIDVVAFSEIKALKGMDAKGDKTKDPDRMLVFQIKANKKYVLGNHSEGFNKVVESLMKYTGN